MHRCRSVKYIADHILRLVSLSSLERCNLEPSRCSPMLCAVLTAFATQVHASVILRSSNRNRLAMLYPITCWISSLPNMVLTSSAFLPAKNSRLAVSLTARGSSANRSARLTEHLAMAIAMTKIAYTFTLLAVNVGPEAQNASYKFRKSL
jgi:hypothetical protein